MWELYEEMWNQQIGNKMNIGFDFSGREIHKNDFGNPLSEFGWTLLPFGDEESYLVVHNQTMKEFPDKVNGEFVVNNKTFEIKKSLIHDGNWDINQILYKTPPEEIVEKIKIKKHNENNEINDDYFNFDNVNDDEFDNDMMLDDFSTPYQQYDEQDQDNEIGYNEDLLEDYDVQNESSARQYVHDSNKQNLVQNNEQFYSSNNQENIASDKALVTISEQQKEIDELKKQIAHQQTQQLEIAMHDKAEIERLKQQINQTQMIEVQNRNQAEMIKDLNNKLDQQNHELNSLRKGQQLKVEQLSEKIRELEKTQMFSIKKSLENEKIIFDNIKNNNLQNQMNNSFYDNTKEIDFSNGIQGYYDSLWESQFGNKEYASDFANRIISKKEYGKNVEGGWGIDYYDPRISSDSFIASTKTIKERNGKLTFEIDGNKYVVTRNDDYKWEIVKHSITEYEEVTSSSSHLTSIANKYQPREKREFNGNYESYSSLIINLNHFPISHLSEFEDFLKQTTNDFLEFKDMYIYSNVRAYNDRRTNISAYARIYFKSSSVKETMKILLFASSMKKAINKFVVNFRNANKTKVISFSMVLMNHLRKIKFIQAQTNFEILRANPIPLRIPLERLIIDSEYNALLKFYENELWKLIKPYALDWHGNTYYICDIDFDKIKVEFKNY